MASTFSAPQVAATLSAVAYLGKDEPNFLRRGRMNKAIADTLGNDWQVAWGPATYGMDLAYVASNGSGTYAVVVRGTLLTRIEDLIQDKTVDAQVDLPFTAPSFPGAQISQGAQEVWTNISKMSASSASNQDSVSLLGFLQGLSDLSTLIVTGHSLGGQTATVLAAWFQSSNLAGATVLPLTMAAPTAGNQAFASAYSSVFDAAGAMNFANQLDVVPLLWTVAGLNSILSMYQGGPACGPLCTAAVNNTLTALSSAGVTYVQPSAVQTLPGALYSVGSVGAFEEEILHQHSALYYMFMLGIPLGTVQVLNKDWAPPSSSVASRSVA
jgi:hypothetical protein